MTSRAQGKFKVKTSFSCHTSPDVALGTTINEPFTYRKRNLGLKEQMNKRFKHFSICKTGSLVSIYNTTWVQVVLVIDNLPASEGDARDVGSVSGLGRSSEEGNGNQLQYSCLENSMDRGAWWAIVYRAARSQTQLSDSHIYSFERLLLKLMLQYFAHLMWRANSLEKTLMLGKIEGNRVREWKRIRWLDLHV